MYVIVGCVSLHQQTFSQVLVCFACYKNISNEPSLAIALWVGAVQVKAWV